MALITPQEIIDLVIMVLAIGFIFKDYVKVRDTREYEPLDEIGRKRSFFGGDFRNSILVAAPAVVLHEAGHKIAALSFGFEATFHAAYPFLGLGVVLKLLKLPFIFLVPGYVQYFGGDIEPLVRSFIAFAGPLANLALFLFATIAIRRKWFEKHLALLILTKQINLFLFIFNMIPFGFFDGADVFGGLIDHFRNAFFG